MTTNLERRYRLLLKVLPGWYREDREEEMVGLFLIERTDELDLEHSWPGWGETGAMLGLAVRTRFAAVSAPVGALRLGGVVRWLGVLGLLLSFTYIATAVRSEILVRSMPEFLPQPPWVMLSHFLPVVAFVLLLRGQRTWAKVAYGLTLVVWLTQFFQVQPSVWSVLWHVPSILTLVCLCLGFHKDAPTPSVRPLVWWAGAAVVLGLADVVVLGSGAVVLAVAVLGLRVYAHVRGDALLGRALSVFAVVFGGWVALTYVPAPPEFRGYLVVAAALLVISAAAPVRRASVLRSRLP
ncbi:hypothetical protein UK23_39520 [Lentzea aerocolonigenes]|uniref:Uncharacterized protein n=1 Tax=Lentzea aerocolonigenes TaxID=68170 RepID=A0A0F0GHJ2_LENAE|nr:hypothetical protein [Lentzea aerocolonigenes]KJK41961.1 hypothetical protein UK23_39520 [Lentzea aerocolonigenes]